MRTAILMTLRNEDPGRAMVRLRTVQASLDATGHGGAFAYFVLSDTSSPEVARAEEAAVAAWRGAVADPGRIVYRRRVRNTGFKAGNVHEFCETHGRDYDLMLPLDADSLMSGEAIVRLVRIMQAHPQLGILQSLVVGAPSTSAFARIFQFGMRHGMRAYTMGSAWWIGDCGPFWGHNALVRIAPSPSIAAFPSFPAESRSGAMCSRTTRSRRRSCARRATRCACSPTSAAPGRKTRPPSSSFRPATCAGARATCSTSSSWPCPASCP